MDKRLKTDITVYNLTSTKQSLAELPKSSQARVLRPAVTGANTLVVKAVRPLVPQDTGLLKLAIGTKIKTYKNGTVVGLVGARSGFNTTTKSGKLKKPTKYAHLAEKNTAAHQILSRNGKPLAKPINHPGSKGKHFILHGFNSVKNQVGDVMREGIARGIEKETERLRLKNEKKGGK